MNGDRWISGWAAAIGIVLLVAYVIVNTCNGREAAAKWESPELPQAQLAITVLAVAIDSLEAELADKRQTISWCNVYFQSVESLARRDDFWAEVIQDWNKGD